MYKLFKGSDTYTCPICDGYINRSKIHVILGFNIMPYNLLFFHLKHYITYLEILENYFRGKDNRKLEEFSKKTVTEVEQEREIAKHQGLGKDYEEDLN